MKFLTFFSFLWIIFALLVPNPDADTDPDPATQINADPDTDPDPQTWVVGRESLVAASRKMIGELRYCETHRKMMKQLQF
jgi:hypothetical protein